MNSLESNLKLDGLKGLAVCTFFDKCPKSNRSHGNKGSNRADRFVKEA